MEQLERTKLVAHIENELERVVARGAHPKTGILPSERTLARRFGVARGTIREALLRLAARGLIEMHPGRQARAVALGSALTLENLGVALHDLERDRSGRRQLLRGYFELKRETTVALLVHCCEHASDAELERLTAACLALSGRARLDDGSRRWVADEFELLRTAALAAERPGHLLLVQSLERAFWGMAGFLSPLLLPEAVRHWADQTMYWLFARNVETLRRGLPPLLLACDEHILGSLEPIQPPPPPQPPQRASEQRP